MAAESVSIRVHPWISCPQSPRAARTSGPWKRAEVEGGQGVAEPGMAIVEHAPLETYDFTPAGRIGSESQSTGYGLVDRGKF